MTGLVFLWTKISPQEWLHTKQPKHSCIYMRNIHVQRLTQPSQRPLVEVVSCNVFKGVITRPPLCNVGVRETANEISGIAVPRIVFAEFHQSLRLAKWQRTQQYRIHHAE